jgi:hypothetical protein
MHLGIRATRQSRDLAGARFSFLPLRLVSIRLA